MENPNEKSDSHPARVPGLLRNDFYGFVERSFYELNTDTTFLHNWHIELIASELEACRRGTDIATGLVRPVRDFSAAALLENLTR
jgi:hypothetical protein